MARLGCRQPPGRTGIDPGGPHACGRARTGLPPAAARPARRPAAARPPPAARPAARPRRPGRRGRRGRQDAGQQRGGLLLRARHPQPVQQPATRAGRRGRRGRRITGQPARRPAPARPPPAGSSSSLATPCGSSRATWAAARSASAVACSRAPASRSLSSSRPRRPGRRGGRGRRITGQQRGGLLLRARLPQPVQQPGHGARVVEGDVGDGPAHGADVSAEVVRRVG